MNSLLLPPDETKPLLPFFHADNVDNGFSRADSEFINSPESRLIKADGIDDGGKRKKTWGARRDNLETFVLKLGYDAMTELIGSSFINGLVLTRQSRQVFNCRKSFDNVVKALLENGE